LKPFSYAIVWTVSSHKPSAAKDEETTNFLKLLEETNTKDHDNLLQPPTAKNKDSLLSNLVLVLIFPGAGGPDSFTMELERNLMESLGGQQHQHQQHQDDNTKIEEECGSKFIVETLDWKQYRGSILSAAYDGEAFGEAIGELILQRYHESLQQRGETTMQQQQQQQEEEHQNILHAHTTTFT
jgi:hypothetical protein